MDKYLKNKLNTENVWYQQRMGSRSYIVHCHAMEQTKYEVVPPTAAARLVLVMYQTCLFCYGHGPVRELVVVTEWSVNLYVCMLLGLCVLCWMLIRLVKYWILIELMQYWMSIGVYVTFLIWAVIWYNSLGLYGLLLGIILGLMWVFEIGLAHL